MGNAGFALGESGIKEIDRRWKHVRGVNLVDQPDPIHGFGWSTRFIQRTPSMMVIPFIESTPLSAM